MRLIGYCTVCHKVRWVRVTVMTSRQPHGICRECEEKQR